VPIVLSLLRSAVLPSETVNSSLFLSALGYMKRVKGNAPGFSTPVSPTEQTVCISMGKEEEHHNLGLFNDVPLGFQ
jgi:hypothetical protein